MNKNIFKYLVTLIIFILTNCSSNKFIVSGKTLEITKIATIYYKNLDSTIAKHVLILNDSVKFHEFKTDKLIIIPRKDVKNVLVENSKLGFFKGMKSGFYYGASTGTIMGIIYMAACESDLDCFIGLPLTIAALIEGGIIGGIIGSFVGIMDIHKINFIIEERKNINK